MKRIPVILDTDIGSDIDDTWAVAMLLKSPELDVKLIVSDRDDTVYRAKLIARMLEVAGRTDIPVGVGLHRQNVYTTPYQSAWVEGYDLAQYPGTVHQDGVGALVDVIMGAPEPITLVCIGPLPNIGAALEQEPRLAARARFVGMHGCLRTSHRNAGVVAESNVVNDVAAAQRVFRASWGESIITPFATCGRVVLKGERYQRLRTTRDPVMQAVMDNYRIWASGQRNTGRGDPETASTVLFDTVAVYLAYTQKHLVVERMGIRVTDEGVTVSDPAAPEVQVAMDWSDLDAYEELLTDRLLGPVTETA
jgi:inosine-uridine nucleoside N-ribohydrolase